MKERIAAERKLLTVPPDAAEVAKLGSRYASAALGEIAVTKADKAVFDFGEFKSEVASRKNPDGTVSFAVDPVDDATTFEITEETPPACGIAPDPVEAPGA